MTYGSRVSTPSPAVWTRSPIRSPRTAVGPRATSAAASRPRRVGLTPRDTRRATTHPPPPPPAPPPHQHERQHLEEEDADRPERPAVHEDASDHDRQGQRERDP